MQTAAGKHYLQQSTNQRDNEQIVLGLERRSTHLLTDRMPPTLPPPILPPIYDAVTHDGIMH